MIPSLKAAKSRFITTAQAQVTLTEHVAEDNSHPPQLGIQYPVGFENGLNIDEFEGIRPDYRGTFKWNGSYLYYRYAKDGEFGVARVNTWWHDDEDDRSGSWEVPEPLEFCF